jgi:hypothetical protein
MKAVRAEGRMGLQAQGKAAMGTLAAGYLAWLAGTGRLSGIGPQDSSERAALMEKGWRPNSVKIGDRWVSYQLMQPLSVQASIIANAYEGWQARGAKPKDALDVASQLMARSVNSFTDQSFLSGLSDLQEALKDPDRSAASFVGRIAHGLSPFSGFQRTIQQGMDPTVRRPRGVVEQVESFTPGLSTRVPARIDRFGQPVVREGGPVRRMLDPFNTSTEQHDPIADELSRLGLTPSVPTGRIMLPGRRSLTPEQQRDVAQRQGQAVRVALEREMMRPGYPRMPDVVRTRVLEHAINAAHEQVNAQARRELMRPPVR